MTLAVRYLGHREGTPLAHFTGAGVSLVQGQEFVVGHRTLLGRSSDADIRVLAGRVARHHCVLRLQDGGVHIEDLGSTNGLLLLDDPDGQVHRELQLEVGARFSVAGCFHFEVVQLKDADS